MKLLNRTLLIYLVTMSFTSICGEPTSYHLGNRWQMKNNILDLLGGSPALSKKASEFIMANHEHFGGGCDLYEMTFYDEESFLAENLAHISLTYQVNKNKQDVRCKSESDLSTPNFIKGVARNAITSAFCYEVFDNPEDPYGTVAHLKSIMCEGECGSQLKSSHIKNLYDHFYFYRRGKPVDIGKPSDWGVDPTNIDESLKVLGIAFCSDPNWTHF